jgi:hypothetical protein
MTTIRCLRNVLHVGDLYLRKGQTAGVADDLAATLIKAKSAEAVSKPKAK